MTKKNVVLFANAQDPHVCAVDYVLSALGGYPIILNTANIPDGERLSITYTGTEPRVRIGDFEGSLSDVNSSWNRRFSKLFTIPNDAHPADKSYIRNNTSSTLLGLAALLDRRFPVNPLAASRLTSNKLLQLDYASQCGFKVPQTLVSNHEDDIAGFLEQVREACVKPYNTQTWRTEKGLVQALAIRIPKDHTYPLSSFRITPHIFQQYIKKRAEYRLVIFGGFAAAVKIDSEKLGDKASVDWKQDPSYLEVLSPVTLTESVVAAARLLLRKLGLRFGAFDLAEDSEGDFVFFEVNEAGQWLWQEVHCPDCQILLPFCEYLLSADERFVWKAKPVSHEYNAAKVYETVKAESKYERLLAQRSPDADVYHADERASA